MANAFYNSTGNPGTRSPGLSATVRAEFAAIAAGFDKLPSTFVANRPVVVNSGGTALTLAGGGLILAGDLTTSGAFNTTLVQQASVTLTLPASSDTLVGRATTDTLSNKTLANPAVTGGSNVTGAGKVVLDTAPTLSNPVVGTQAITDDSPKAASTAFMQAFFAAQDVAVQSFTANGTYTPNAKMVRAVLISQAGGGGGGGVSTPGNPILGRAPGGGSGATAITFVTKADVGASQTVTIGAAGSGGGIGGAGGTGGDTSIGSLAVAKGGGGGGGGQGSSPGAAGGSVGGNVGDIVLYGQSGAAGDAAENLTGRVVGGGQGGSSPFGAGGANIALGATSGAAANGNGAGGGGGVGQSGVGGAGGGVGTAGVAYVIEILKP